MSNYLRNRPFMVITYTYTLKAGQKSNAAGFSETAEWEPLESMVINDRVSDKQAIKADLILDLLESKVVKCRDNTLDHKKLFDHFVNRYFEDVKAALSTWIAKDTLNKMKVEAYVEARQKEEANDEE